MKLIFYHSSFFATETGEKACSRRGKWWWNWGGREEFGQNQITEKAGRTEASGSADGTTQGGRRYGTGAQIFQLMSLKE